MERYSTGTGTKIFQRFVPEQNNALSYFAARYRGAPVVLFVLKSGADWERAKSESKKAAPRGNAQYLAAITERHVDTDAKLGWTPSWDGRQSVIERILVYSNARGVN
uniref:Uncharacterized protein n=1 Tax=Romanomermis culicivorax TaxID=13658 RepID=A0A915JHP2_ROMCU